MSAKPGVRADFEDALSKAVTRDGVEAITGNTILPRPEGSKLDINYLKSQVKEFRIDAVIVSRLVKVDKSITYVPGQPYMPYPYYGSFYGYYGAVYPVVYSPDYLREDTTVRVETNVYAVTSGEGQLVWTGVSDTFNPSSTDKVIDGLSKQWKRSTTLSARRRRFPHSRAFWVCLRTNGRHLVSQAIRTLRSLICRSQPFRVNCCPWLRGTTTRWVIQPDWRRRLR